MFSYLVLGLGIYCILLLILAGFYLYKRTKGTILKFHEEYDEFKENIKLPKVRLRTPSSGMVIQIAAAIIGGVTVLGVGSIVISQVKDTMNMSSVISSGTTTVYSGFALIGVVIIIMAAFGLINMFK